MVIMTGEDLISLIQQEILLDSSSANELRKLSENFPWFHTPRLLLLRHLKETGSPLFDSQFSRAAAYLSGREMLFSLLIPPGRPMEELLSVPADPGLAVSEPNPEPLAEPEVPERPTSEVTTAADPDDDEPSLSKSIADIVARQASVIGQELSPDFELEIDPVIGIITPAETSLDELAEQYRQREVPEISSSNPNVGEELLLIEEATDQVVDAEAPAEPISQEFAAEITFPGETSAENGITSIQGPFRTEQDDISYFEKELSFSDWLSSVSAIPEYEEEPALAPMHHHSSLIDQFIRNNPRIEPRVATDHKTVEDASERSVSEHESFITDTLAQIYVRQGLYSKAIQAYEKLSLKFPEKSSYFASQIEKVKEYIKK